MTLDKIPEFLNLGFNGWNFSLDLILDTCNECVNSIFQVWESGVNLILDEMNSFANCMTDPRFNVINDEMSCINLELSEFMDWFWEESV